MRLSKHIIPTCTLFALQWISGSQLIIAAEKTRSLDLDAKSISSPNRSLDNSTPQRAETTSLRLRSFSGSDELAEVVKRTESSSTRTRDSNRMLQGDANASDTAAGSEQQESVNKSQDVSSQEGGQQQQKQQQMVKGGDDDDEDGDSTMLIILFIAVLFAAYMARKRMLSNKEYEGRWIVGNHDPDEGDDYNIRTLNAGQEMVPLSNEDEWGWEDNARTKRDLEAGSGNEVLGREELNSVLSPPPVSVSERTLKTNNLKRPGFASSSSNGNGNGNGNSTKSFKAHSKKKSPSRSAKNLASAPRTEMTNSWDDESDWDDDEPSAPVTATPAPIPSVSPSKQKHVAPAVKPKKSPPLAPKSAPKDPPTVEELLAEQLKNSHAPAITSFSKPKPTTPAKSRVRAAAQKKDEDEDIFASMGLSTVPKKSTSSSSFPRPSAATATVAASTATPKEKTEPPSSWNRSNLEALDGSDAGSNWDNDEDLDDLLDD